MGHYRVTQQPGRAEGFALAGHRNTHGEPFRYLPPLRPGDDMEVATRSATYTYDVDEVLPQTSATDSGVLRPVPGPPGPSRAPSSGPAVHGAGRCAAVFSFERYRIECMDGGNVAS